MATTPIYTFTTPDLTGTADGPAAMAALATRVEREMTTLRGCVEYTQEPNSGWGQNTTGNVIFNFTAPVSVIGYLDISATINLVALGGTSDVTSGSFAGFMKINVDGTDIRNYRFHSLWGTRMVCLAISGKAANSAAQTSRNIKLIMDLQAGWDVSVNQTNVNVCQVGAPGTG